MSKIKYICNGCGVRECKLWRLSHTFLDCQRLLCGPCALAKANLNVPIDAGGFVDGKYGRSDQIGSMLPAVPTVEMDTYWGYTSVPEDRVAWWRALPLEGKLGRIPKETKPKPPKPVKIKEPTKFLDNLKDDPRAQEVVAMVEADSFAQHQLWLTWYELGLYGQKDSPPHWSKDFRCRRGEGIIKTWEQMNPGHIITIAKVGRWPGTARPVCVSIFYNRINGQVVGFYDPCSQLVDSVLVEEWVRQNFPKAVIEDAHNFHNAMRAVKDANEKRIKELMAPEVRP